MSFEIHSSAFDPGGAIPRKHTGEGRDVSPPLVWSDPPAGAREFALVVDDPDAPRAQPPGGQPWVHWVLHKTPANEQTLDEGRADPTLEGVNDSGRRGWGGPLPPSGHGAHRYQFHLYALDAPLELGPGASKQQRLVAMKGHVTGEATLVGTYERGRRMGGE